MTFYVYDGADPVAPVSPLYDTYETAEDVAELAEDHPGCIYFEYVAPPTPETRALEAIEDFHNRMMTAGEAFDIALADVITALTAIQKEG